MQHYGKELAIPRLRKVTLLRKIVVFRSLLHHTVLMIKCAFEELCGKRIMIPISMVVQIYRMFAEDPVQDRHQLL